jgi:hypothetical protein
VLAVGDAPFQEKCFETFRQLKRNGRTVVYVTHDLSSVERFCDRAMLLERGNAMEIGDPRSVIQTYRQLNLQQEQAEHGAGQRKDPARWGDQAAEIVEAWFEDEAGARRDVLSQAQRAILNVRISFRRRMERPVFGAILKNERAEQVFVTNTMLDGIDTGVYSPGDQIVYRIALDPHLSDGRYTVTSAVAHQDAERFADWWEDLLSVRVRADRYTGGIVDFPHEVTIEREGAEQRGPVSVPVPGDPSS